MHPHADDDAIVGERGSRTTSQYRIAPVIPHLTTTRAI
jgi:hypothetical protein